MTVFNCNVCCSSFFVSEHKTFDDDDDDDVTIGLTTLRFPVGGQLEPSL